MGDYANGTLAIELRCIFGIGKSFRNRDEATLSAGAKVAGRYDADGWHKFTVLEPSIEKGTYAVRNASILDTALGLDAAPSPRDQAVAEIRRLMKSHGITAGELG